MNKALLLLFFVFPISFVWGQSDGDFSYNYKHATFVKTAESGNSSSNNHVIEQTRISYRNPTDSISNVFYLGTFKRGRHKLVIDGSNHTDAYYGTIEFDVTWKNPARFETNIRNLTFQGYNTSHHYGGANTEPAIKFLTKFDTSNDTAAVFLQFSFWAGNLIDYTVTHTGASSIIDNEDVTFDDLHTIDPVYQINSLSAIGGTSSDTGLIIDAVILKKSSGDIGMGSYTNGAQP